MQQQMTGQSQSQQPMFTTPPQVITGKDLNYLADQMNWLLVAAKKCSHYAKECTDPQIKQIIDQTGQMHQRHYNTLLTHCQNNNSSATASLPAQ
ncbi:hypothetical protein DFP93_11819 [Aneurinibacillus soli]|uniref:Uncharacterized protein n=1 Tax=Aneurinibacillus soli TaxID=1500254 RepID=A0A0U4NCR9_9BACL|nr:hypothetical protein [Aneurinibacillus soli]PYE59270.1 hypothetical protein DFP93_11819 [Aneurinibacillus soli]BAU26740.1 hypothetical protein CB4_00883 [Aneurinibacillus soli]